MSALAASMLLFPTRPNSRARNLAMDMDWTMIWPSYSKQGRWLNGIAAIAM
jgi:hypothetical protein